MDAAQHAKEHQVLGYTLQMARLKSAVTGAAVIDMANADYTMSQAESQCSLIYVGNPGNGTKILTIGAYDSTPLRQTVFVLGSAPIGVKYDGEASVAPAFQNLMNPVIRIPTFGMVRDGAMAVIKSSAGGTTTAGNTNEQVIEQLIIPAASWKDNETTEVEFSGLKSNTATTETLRIRIGDQGDTTDVQIWTNAGMATTVVAVASKVKVQRISATVVVVTSILNVLSPNGSTTINTCFQRFTVDNMDNNPVYISITGQNSTGAETVTSKFFRGVLSS